MVVIGMVDVSVVVVTKGVVGDVTGMLPKDDENLCIERTKFYFFISFNGLC